MFTNSKWFRRGRIESEEGFSVSFGRDSVIYRESGRTIVLTADVGAGQAIIFTDSIGRWDDDVTNSVEAEEQSRIADNVKRALE